MLDRIVQGAVPRKHHLAFRDAGGALLYEEAYTRAGFDGPYTLAYHRGRPHATRPAEARHGSPLPRAAPPRPLARRHYRTQDLAPRGGAPVDARVPLLFNDDVVLSLVDARTRPDPVYFSNGDGDDLLFVLEGGGLLRSPLGDLRFERDDYVYVPRGLLHRLVPDAGPAALARPSRRPAASTSPRSGGTRPASSAWTRPTRTATSGASSGRGRRTRGSASSS